MLYVDTSVLVAALLPEAQTVPAQEWLAAQRAGDLAISDWTITEFSSALSLKQRTGQIEIAHREAALTAFMRIAEESLFVLQIFPSHFRAAALLCDQADLGLRAADALHLAVAKEHGATLATFDNLILKVGSAVGVDCISP